VVVVAHHDGDDFVWMCGEPSFHENEVSFKSAGIEEVARGVAEPDFLIFEESTELYCEGLVLAE
jgi:hypothetical protein